MDKNAAIEKLTGDIFAGEDCDIAIIGLGCRVPEAENVDIFWENLVKGKEALVDFGDEELRAEAISEELLQDASFVKAGTRFDGFELFDAAFFGFNPKEAEMADPQQRLFLEEAWTVLERAGYGSPGSGADVGVYAGVGTNGYLRNVVAATDSQSFAATLLATVGNERDTLATLVSYKFNLTGPSVTVHTACSTSLVAVHLACQGLLAGDCTMALAGGVSIAVPQRKGYLYEPGGILSPDGHCRAYDAGAGGTVMGSGVGLVLLKRLREAVADGDVIYAVIKGSSVNNDGSRKVGYTAPSVEGQARVIRAAQLVAGVEAENISYIEGHGTGTVVGDPIEVAALTQAFRISTKKKGYCALGSVKSNIGHLDTAAGIIGLIKTVLALEHKQIPASLHYQRANPEIDFENSPFFVNRELRAWEGPAPLRAGVSSFGIGGTNAHVIVEEAPHREPSGPGRSAQLLVLSARTQAALDAATEKLAAHLSQRREDKLADVAYTLQVGRREFTHRRAVVCKTREEAVERLQRLGPEVIEGVAQEKGSGVVFIFPGQGAQYVGMGQEIYQEERVFREVVDECSEKLKPEMGLDLRELLYPVESRREWAERKIQETEITQPALFVVEYALAQMWMQWGIRPQAMLGHSIGEYVAACIAGVMGEEEALRLVSLRGRLMQEQALGSMLAVELPEEEAEAELKPGLWLAAVNGRRQCVLSGTEAAITEVQRRLEERLITCHRLRTSHAFHSGEMEPALKPFAEGVKGVRLGSPQIRYISNVTGTWLEEREATDPEYWVRHLRQTVRFGGGIETVLQDIGNCVFVEVGPGESLGGLVRAEAHRQKKKVPVVSSLGRAGAGEGEMGALLKAAGKLWTAGARVQWGELHGGERRLRVALPTYPFERKRYWISDDSTPSKAAVTAEPIKQTDIADWFYVPVWRQAPFLSGGEQGQGQDWLIFLDEEGMGESLAEQITGAGHRAVVVRRGEELIVEENAYTINPEVKEHYGELIADLGRRKRIPQRILHLWSILGSGRSGEPSLLRVDGSGFMSLQFLVQSLGVQHITSPIQLTVLSADAHVVTGDETVSPAAASVLAACLVISQEYPNLQCRAIDVRLSEKYSYLKSGLLMADIMSPPLDFFTAYRGGQRWVRTFEKVRLADTGSRATRLRMGGVYLITGGLGKIGLAIAEYLVRNAKAKLVLMGRTKFPAAEEWEECLCSSDKDSEMYLKVEKLSQLRKQGAEIMVAAADVSRLEEVRQVISEAQKGFGRIDGVFHAAGHTGLASLQTIARQTVDDFEAHMGPKVTGLKVLQAALAGEPPDFIVLFSSISAVLGGIGYSACAATNMCLDELSHWYRQQGLAPCISINWDGWNFGEAEQRRAAGGIQALAMLPQEGIQVLHRVLQTVWLPSQLVISTSALSARLNNSVMVQPSPELKREPSIAETRLEQIFEPGSAAYVKPETLDEVRLAAIWEQLLGVKPISAEDGFLDVGGSSLLAVRLLSQMRNKLGFDVPIEIVLGGCTVRSLATYISDQKALRPTNGHPLHDGATRQPQLVAAARQQMPFVPLQRRQRPERIPLSFGQQRLWFLERLGSGTAHIVEGLRVKGELDYKALRRALNRIVERHEALRTTIQLVDGEPVQRISGTQESSFALIEQDLRGHAETEREERVQEAISREWAEPFDLENGPLLRVKLLRMGEQEHVLLITIHHLMGDGWSMEVLARELRELYGTEREQREAALEELPMQYGDYAAWQRESLAGGELKEQMGYWKKQLAGLERLELPTDHPRPAVVNRTGTMVQMELGEELSRRIRELCRREGLTLFMALLGGVQVLLGRYTGQQDVAVGMVIANRTRREIESLIGYFANTLVLRGDVRNEWSFRELLKRVREATLAAYAHQEVPFEHLVEELQTVRDSRQSPLFDVMLNAQDSLRVNFSLPGLSLEELDTERLYHYGRSGEVETFMAVPTWLRRSLIFRTFAESVGIIRIGIDYATELYEQATIERMGRHFRALLEEMTSNADSRIGEVTILSNAERVQLKGWNRTEQEYPQRWMHELFEDQVARKPKAVAVEYEDEGLSYQELNRRSNQLAHYLKNLGVGPEVEVALCLERSLEMVVAIMAVLKAGGAYLPLDPSYPAERLSYMLEDSAAPVLLGQARLQEKWLSYTGKTIHVDAEWETIERCNDANLRNEVSAENLAYVIYTSGSTGEPKGVTNTHQGLSNRVQWMQQAYGLTAADRVLQKSPFDFDVSVWEFLWPLMAGARLVMLRPGGHQDPACIAETIQRKQITTLHFVPAMLRVFLACGGAEQSGSLRRIICSGEALDSDLARECREQIQAELHNLYGPSEASTDVTSWDCSELSDVVMIGKPIANTQIHVLDSGLQPVPVGVAGELYIGGTGLARGYLNQPGLTAERFVPSPLASCGGERLYRTGDRAKRHEDGNLEYLGRLGQQVKIRGYQIELGEIEAILRRHPEVGEAAMVVQEGEEEGGIIPGEKRLVAYYTAAGAGTVPDPETLRRYMAEKLPESMVPAAYVHLEKMPLMPNGKLNRKMLPEPKGNCYPKGEYEAPQGEIETALAPVWCEVLKLERIGRHDDFFQCGGHSLLATQLISKIRSRLDLDLPLRALFERSTVARFAELIGVRRHNR
jgi:amino acid adenylation domain-containing protein